MARSEIDYLREAVANPGAAISYLYNNRQNFYRGLKLGLTSRVPVGRNVFNYNWDLLIILDTCRFDALQEMTSDYNFLTDISKCWSIGGNTLEWISQTFADRYLNEIRRTRYVTANGYAELVLDERVPPERHLRVGFVPTAWNTVAGEELVELRHVWKYTERALPTIGRKYPPANAVTDHAIQIHREDPTDRLIAHYIRPHFPYIEQAVAEGRSELYEYEAKPYEYLKAGGDRSKVWDKYTQSLKTVLDEVEVLLENIDAQKVVITADHGDAFGEFQGYGHPAGSFNPKVRTVPWVKTTADDLETRRPTIDLENVVESDTPSVEDHLKALGYKV